MVTDKVKEFNVFKSLCEVVTKCDKRLNEFKSSIEKAFGGDTSIMITWPIEMVQEMLTHYMIWHFECTTSEVDWFIYESGILEGYVNAEHPTHVYPDENTCLEVRGVEDYFNYLCGDYDKLMQVESPYLNISEARVSGSLVLTKDGLNFVRSEK